MAGDLGCRNDGRALGGRNDKTRRERQHHQEPEAMRSNIQTLNKSRPKHQQQRQGSRHLVAPHNTSGNRENATMAMNPQASSYLFPYHHDSSTFARTGNQEGASQDMQRSLMGPRPTFDAMEASHSTWSFSTPQNLYGRGRLGSEAEIGAATANMINAMHQAARSLDIQQPCELQTSTIHRSMSYSQNMMAPHFHNGESPVRGHCRVGLDKSNMTDRKCTCIQPILGSSKQLNLSDYHQQKNSYENKSIRPNCKWTQLSLLRSSRQLILADYQQQPESSRHLSSTYNSNSIQGGGVAKYQNARGGFSRRQSNFLPQCPTALTPAGKMGHGDNKDGKAGRLENLAALVRASEPDTVPSIRTGNPGTIEPPRRVEDLKIAFENTLNRCNSKNAFTFQNLMSENEFPWHSKNGSRGFQTCTTRHNVSDLPSNTNAFQVLARNDVACNLTTWQNNSTILQTQSVPEGKLYKERARSVDEACWAATSKEVKDVAVAIQAEIDKLINQHDHGFMQHFRPSNSLLRQHSLLEAGETQVSAEQYGCSTNYRGDITIAKNRSAEIADSQNCAVWILGLPENVTHTELLGAIRNVGKVYCAVINPPTGQHQTSAAKIVFFERHQAESFMALALNGHLQVMGREIRHVRWNKIKSARYPYTENSRVIHVTGPRHLMDFKFFEGFFTRLFEYQLEGKQEVECAVSGMVTHEWRFGSLRCQAASAKTAIERELRGVFAVEWARDPCL